MAKTKEIIVESEFKLGFDHSYSSISQRHGGVIILELGDDEAKVRKEYKKGYTADAVADCVKAKKKYDKPKEK